MADLLADIERKSREASLAMEAKKEEALEATSSNASLITEELKEKKQEAILTQKDNRKEGIANIEEKKIEAVTTIQDKSADLLETVDFTQNVATEEYLDVLDENGKFTGISHPRSQVHREGLWHRVVHVWIVNSKGQVLLQQRTLNKESWPGMWDISSAGHISAGEGSLVTAARELHEELGIELIPQELKLLFSTKMESILNGGKYINREWVDVYILERDLDEKTLILQESEVNAVAWMDHRVYMAKLRSNDPTFVPNHPDGNYAPFFAYLQQRFSS